MHCPPWSRRRARVFARLSPFQFVILVVQRIARRPVAPKTKRAKISKSAKPYLRRLAQVVTHRESATDRPAACVSSPSLPPALCSSERCVLCSGGMFLCHLNSFLMLVKWLRASAGSRVTRAGAPVCQGKHLLAPIILTSLMGHPANTSWQAMTTWARLDPSTVTHPFSRRGHVPSPPLGAERVG